MSGISVSGGGLYWDASLNGSHFKRELDVMAQKLGRFDSTVSATGNNLDEMFKRAAVAAASFFSVQKAYEFVNALIKVRGEFEQLEVAYSTILQSKAKGDALFKETVQLAATTPFNLSEVAQSTKQLLAYGVAAEDVTDTLRMLGDIASGVSAPIGDIAYLYGTLKTQGRAYMMDIRQFTGRGIPIIKELANQFHVSEQEVNKLVEAGRVGFPEVEKAFKSLTGQGGIFFNLMEQQSQTLTGRLSNLEDAFDQMLNNIGKANSDTLNVGITAVSKLVENYQVLLDVLKDIVVAYGVYKAATIAETAYTAVSNNVKALQAERAAIIENGVERQKAAGQELYAATVAKQAALEKYKADQASLIVARERLVLAQAENEAALLNINATNKVTAAKNLQLATSEALKAQEVAEISRKAALAASGEVYIKSLAVQTTTANAATLATTELTTAQALSAGATNLLGTAWKRLTTFLAANPILAIAGAAALFYHYISKLNDEMDSLSLTTKGYLTDLQQEREKLNDVTDRAKLAAQGTKERSEAIKVINDQYGTYLPHLLTEASSNKDISDSFDILNGKIRENINLRFRQKNIEKAENTYKDVADPAFETLLEKMKAGGKVTSTAQAGIAAENAVTDLTKLYDKLRVALKKSQDVTKINQEILKVTQDFNKKFNINQGFFDNKFGEVGVIAAARARFNGQVEDATATFVNDRVEKAKQLSAEEQAELDRIKRFSDNIKNAYANFAQLIKDARGKANFTSIKEALENEQSALTATLAPDKKQIEAIRDRITEVNKTLSIYDDKNLVRDQKKKAEDQKRFLEALLSDELDIRAKGVEKNEGELLKLQEKFQKQREEATKLGLDKGVLTRIDNAEKQATGFLKEEQGNEALKKDLEERKKLYEGYAAAIEKTSQDEADSIYGKSIKDGKTYKEYLEGLLSKIPLGILSNAMQQRKQFILDGLDEVNRKEKEQQLNAISQVKTYEEQRRAIIVKYQRIEQELLNAASSAQNNDLAKTYQDRAKLTQKQRDDELNALTANKVQETDAYKRLFGNLEEVTVKQAKQDIATLEKLLSEFTGLNSDAAKELLSRLKGVKLALSELDSRSLHELGNEFQFIANQVSVFDQKLGKSLSTVGQIINGIGDIKESFKNIKSPNTDFLGKAGSVLGIFGTVIGVVTSVVNLFSHAQEKAEQAAYANNLQLKATQAINKALERQLSLVKDIYGPTRIDAYKKQIEEVNKAIEKNQQALVGRTTLTGNKGIDKEITKRNNGEPGNSFADDIINKLKEAGVAADLTNKSIKDLQALLEGDRLDEQTAAIVQSLIDLQEQGKQAQNALTEDLTGINLDSLNDKIRSVFDSGEIDAKNFANAIEDSIRGAFNRAFQRKEIEERMQVFYNELYKAGEDGSFSDEEIKTLRELRDKISMELADRAKVYEQIIGPLESATVNKDVTTLAGAIKGITAEEANVLEGTTRGIQLNTARLLQVNTDQMAELKAIGQLNQELWEQNERSFLYTMKIEANTRRTADNTDGIRDILIGIKQNTADTTGALLRAAGKVV